MFLFCVMKKPIYASILTSILLCCFTVNFPQPIVPLDNILLLLLLLLLLLITHTKENRCNKRKINGYREGLREGNERQKKEEKEERERLGYEHESS